MINCGLKITTILYSLCILRDLIDNCADSCALSIGCAISIDQRRLAVRDSDDRDRHDELSGDDACAQSSPTSSNPPIMKLKVDRNHFLRRRMQRRNRHTPQELEMFLVKLRLRNRPPCVARVRRGC
jgi:hypothetical protein